MSLLHLHNKRGVSLTVQSNPLSFLFYQVKIIITFLKSLPRLNKHVQQHYIFTESTFFSRIKLSLTFLFTFLLKTPINLKKMKYRQCRSGRRMSSRN